MTEPDRLRIDKRWDFKDGQNITLTGKTYNIHAAIMLAEDTPVRNLLLRDFNISYCAPNRNNVRDFVAHMKMVNDADLSYPILLNENGDIIDGRHRLCKALFLGRKYIKVKRFESDPSACWEWE